MIRRLRATAVATALLVAVATAGMLAPNAGAERYVAMGDSYSSGTGTSDYYEANCQRSNFAYGSLIKGDIGGSFRMVACSGAKTGEVLTNTQQGNPPQVNLLGSDTEFVSISIGGNDADFTGTLLECGKPDIWPLSPDCSGAIAASQSTIQNTIPGRLDQVLTRIRQKSPSARISLVGYPRLFPANGDDCGAATFFSASEIQQLNQTADMLADVERARARANGATYVDARPAFLGHAWCEDEWINGLSNPTSDSYHPNKAGHVGYAGIVRAAMLAAPAAARTVAPNGRIAFTAASGGASSIGVVNANGTNPLQLTTGQAKNADPVFSPDGTRIAFASDRAGTGFDIYTMKIDGSDLRRLTTASGDDREPAFSPNGTMLAFRSDRTGNGEIFRMTADGAGQTNLSRSTGVTSGSPAWSPDGSEIAFQRGNEVFKMNADGQGQTNLTGNGATIEDGRPSYSPDGSKIAFHSNRDGNFEIYTMSPTGGSVARRTTETAADRDPSFSPDGSQIVFRSAREGADRIFTMPASSGAATRRTAGGTTDSRPSWQGDSTPPKTTITAGPVAVTGSQTPGFEFSADEAGSTFECRIDNAAFQACVSPFVAPALADGARRFQVRAVDPSGNVEPAPVTRDFTVDTRAKVTSITSGPSGPTADPEPVFEFSSESPQVDFSCRLLPAGTGWSPCESPFSAGPLEDGDYRFEVRGTDQAENVEDPPQVRTFTVDTASPATTVTAGPAALGNDPHPSFEFAASEPGAEFECLVEGMPDAAWSACVSPFNPAGLEDGAYVLRVRATDLAGNAEDPGLTWPFAIDTEAPVTTIDSAPAERVESRDVEIEFSAGEEDARFECRLDSLDDAAWADCDSPVSLTGLSHGLHEFQVRAADAAGNVEAEPRSVEFGVDVIRPVVTIDSRPADPNAQRRPGVAFHSADPDARFECRLDRPSGTGEWNQCLPPFSPSADLTDGRYRFTVRAADVFGHVETSETVEWLLDASPPVASIVAGPRDSVAATIARFELAADEESPAFECALDGAPWAGCGAVNELDGLAEGSHVFRARAAGPLSGFGPVISRNWAVDLTAPALSLDQAPASPSRLRTAEARFHSSEPGHFECRLDSSVESDFSPCVSPHFVFGLADGEHRLDVRAIDAAGNPDTKTMAWTVVTTPPPVTFGATPPPFSPARDARIEFASGRAIASAECRLDGGAWSACSSPAEFNGLRDGPHDFGLKVVDQAGNTATTGYSWTVDTVAPVSRIESGPVGQTTRNDAVFGFTATESPTNHECSLDGAPFRACASPLALDGLATGPHEIRVRATDRAGNTGPVASRAWTVIAPPVIPGPEETVKVSVNFKRSLRVPRGGKFTIGSVTCGTHSCAATGPGAVRIKAGKRRIKIGITYPNGLAPSGSGPIRAKFPRAVKKHLKGRRSSLKLTVTVKADGENTSFTRRISLRG